MQYINRSLDAIVKNWPSGKLVFFRRNGKTWNIGINVTNGRRRFSAGWDRFVRDNQLEVNHIVLFILRGDGVTFDLEIGGNIV